MDCPSCGTPQAHPDQRFCAKCGTNLAPIEPPAAYGQPSRITGPLFADDPPPPPPPYAAPPPYVAPPPAAPPPYVAPPVQQFAPPPPARSRPRRTSVVLLVVTALVAALIGAGGVVLLFGDDETESPPTSATDPGDAADPTTDAGATSSTTASPTESDTSEPTAFECWDGDRVTALAACEPPVGAAGLGWVFASSTGSTCSTNLGAQRASEAECTPDVEGDPVRFHYSEWRSRAALETYYGSNTVASIGAPGNRDDLTALRVTSRDPSVGYKVAVYYADPSALWSVTIYAADETEYLAALDQLEVRPFAQLRGKRA